MAMRASAGVISELPMRKKSMSFDGRELSSGVFTGVPGAIGRTRCGVTMIARSVSFF
jgi:hypothetical protein